MLRGPLTAVVVMAMVALLVPSAPAVAAEPEIEPTPEAMPGQTRADPLLSPHGLLVRGSNGYTLVINATEGRGSASARVRVDASGGQGTVHYSAPADLSGEGIQANLGRFGRIDLRWVPDGRVREVTGKCRAYKTHVYFATGRYVGKLRFRGGNDFSEAVATKVVWRRRWYGENLGCAHSISEGFPGPGAILYAGGAGSTVRPGFSMVENGPGQGIEYFASQRERVGQIELTRDAFASGGPKTLNFLPSFKSAEVVPPAPFSGSAVFSRQEHARGTWLGDLSVDFPDRSDVHLAGTQFEAIFHSGFHEEGIGFSAR
jgi:hypothetical protein